MGTVIKQKTEQKRRLTAVNFLSEYQMTFDLKWPLIPSEFCKVLRSSPFKTIRAILETITNRFCCRSEQRTSAWMDRRSEFN